MSSNDSKIWNLPAKCRFFFVFCKFICTCRKKMLPLQRKTKVLPYQLTPQGVRPVQWAGDTDILKKASLALCFGFLESGKFTIIQNIAAQDAHGMYLQVRACTCVYTYGVGSSVVCSDKKAIPEPQEAEQQDCSPAFCIYVYMKILSK